MRKAMIAATNGVASCVPNGAHTVMPPLEPKLLKVLKVLKEHQAKMSRMKFLIRIQWNARCKTFY